MFQTDQTRVGPSAPAAVVGMGKRRGSCSDGTVRSSGECVRCTWDILLILFMKSSCLSLRTFRQETTRGSYLCLCLRLCVAPITAVLYSRSSDKDGIVFPLRLLCDQVTDEAYASVPGNAG